MARRRGRGAWGAIHEAQHIEGLSQALINFENIRNAYGAQGQSLIDPLYKCAEMIRDAARSNIRHEIKGNLRRGIKAGKFDPGYPEKPAAFTGIDYKISPHAHLVEYGHMTISGGHVPAYPFFRPAIDTNRTRIMMMIKKEMQTQIQKAAAAARAI
jgi:hypothetical protein